MKNNTFDRRSVLKLTGTGIVGSLALTGSASAAPQASRSRGRGPKHVLEIVGTHDHETDEHQFVLSDHELPCGWTTFTFDNQTTHTHFGYLVRVPEAEDTLAGYDGETLTQKYRNAVSLPFQAAWDPYYAGEIDVGEFFGELFAVLPDWFFTDVVPSGGPGLTAGGTTSKTTLSLDPGTYFVECYVLDPDGVFHSTSGMVETIEVTGASSKMPEPEPTLEVSVSTDGIEFDPEDVDLGRQTVGITFEDNTVYGHGLGHDVHLIRLAEGTTTDAVNEWMNYLDVGGDGYYADTGALTTTGDETEPATFLGGVQDIVTDSSPETAYFDVTLRPGDYAWVAEVPDPDGKDMLMEFTVAPRGRRE